MDSNFGVGLGAVLFENATPDVIEDLKERLFIQVEKYMPFIQIVDVKGRIEENTAYFSVQYAIPSLSISDVLSLDVKGNSDFA